MNESSTTSTAPAGESMASRSELVQYWHRLCAWLRRRIPPPGDPRREELWAVPAVVLLVLLLFGPMTERVLVHGPDLGPHTAFALKMQAQQHPVAPHFLFHWLDYTLADALQALGEPQYVKVDNWPLDRTTMAGVIICLLALVWTGLLLYRLFRGITRRDGRPLPAWAALLLVVAAQLFVPIPLLYFLDPGHHHIYLGYIGINTFHSPTTLLTKPLALLLFFASFRVVSAPSGTHRWWTVLGFAAATVLGFLAKPSFLLAYIPALALIALVRLILRKPCDWPALIVGLFLPAALCLAWQVYFVYYTPFFDDGTGHGSANNGIAWMPFKLMGTDPAPLMVVRYLGITLFAAATVAAYFRRAVRDAQMLPALVTGGLGLVISTCLVESGPRMPHGNFLWTAQLVLVVVMAATLRFLVQQLVDPDPADPPRTARIRRAISLTALALQLAMGVLWCYLNTFHAPASQWW